MDLVVTTIAGLALLGTTYALPIGPGIPGGISLGPNALSNFYSDPVVIGQHPVRYAIGFNKDGTISAGFRYASQQNGKDLPVTAAVSGNYKDIKKTLKFEIGTRLLDKLSALILGDKDGLKWTSSFWVPVNGQGGFNSIGGSLEGDQLRPMAISGGFGYLDKVYQARVDLDKDLKPSGTNFAIDDDATLKYTETRRF